MISGDYIQKSTTSATISTRRLYTEINHIGNNINQIARKMNAGLGTKSDVQEVLFLLRKVYEKMEVIADQ